MNTQRITVVAITSHQLKRQRFILFSVLFLFFIVVPVYSWMMPSGLLCCFLRWDKLATNLLETNSPLFCKYNRIPPRFCFSLIMSAAPAARRKTSFFGGRLLSASQQTEGWIFQSLKCLIANRGSQTGTSAFI